MVLEKILQGPLDCKEIQPINRKKNQPWIFTGRTAVEAEAPILCPPDAKNWLTGKDPDPGKDWRQEEKRVTEDETVVWNHLLDGQSLCNLGVLLMNTEAWRAAVHGVAKTQTRLRDWTGTGKKVRRTKEGSFSSVAQSDFLRHHELQHARPPCPSSTPRVYSNSIHWISDAIQPSHPLSSLSPPAPNPSQHQSLFQWVNSSYEVAKVLEFQLQHQSVQWTQRTDLLQDGLVGSPCSLRTLKSLLQHHSSKASIFCCPAFFTVQLSHSYMTTGKTIALTRWTVVGKVMSLLFNMLSRLVITFLPMSKHLLISWLQSPSAVILEPKIVKSDTVRPIFNKLF